MPALVVRSLPAQAAPHLREWSIVSGVGFHDCGSIDHKGLVGRHHPYAVHLLPLMPFDPLPAVRTLVYVALDPVHEQNAADDTVFVGIAYRPYLRLRSVKVGMPSRVRMMRTPLGVRPVRLATSSSGSVPSRAMSSGVHSGP